MRAIRHLIAIGFVIVFACAGCEEPEPELTNVPEQPKDYWAELPPGEMALVKLDDPSTWPDFHEGYHRRTGLEQAVMHSLEYMSKPSSETFYPYLDISHARVIASLEAFLDVLHTAQSANEFDQIIKSRFDIYMSRGCDERGTVLFTGYYRPIFDARRQPEGPFQYPIYGMPDDLVKDPATGDGLLASGGPYLSRGQIDAGALEGHGLELCYLADPFEVYIVTVQGSARLRLKDGSYFDIGYIANNGREYTSVGQLLVEQGAMAPEDLSLQGMIAYFKSHPEQLQLLSANERYIFFAPRGGGPFGSLNCPVTPFRSIATDKSIYPRAAVSFMSTQLPARSGDGAIRQYAYAGFALDQDTGGAIRAAGRCDVFLGTGDEVGELAGRTFAEGQLYYIFLKDNGAYDSATYASPPPPAADEP